MKWDTGLLKGQKRAASHSGSHARLLAGPGTGKTLTLTRRVAYLVAQAGVSPSDILALTFTRAAAAELRSRICKLLGDECEEFPHVSTLHSFSLRQLLRNSDRIDTIPRPLRVADDWEERYIILEDMKLPLGYTLKKVRKNFNLLSADWQTLAADKKVWEKRFPDPKFLGAWRQHRQVFGYTLRSELVYQLKRALEQTSEFSLESDYCHLLVDEYQDLNRCDLAVIYALRDRGLEVFGAGDDDQSIYGFRYAYPEGIRKFQDDYKRAHLYELATCVRCDQSIINLALFVANLDPTRLEKPLLPRAGAGEGKVCILRYKDQTAEAKGVACICKYLVRQKGYKPKDVLILMRSDKNSAFSTVIRDALCSENLPATVRVGGSPLDTALGRILVSILRLLADENDSLALRSLFMLRENRIGQQCCSAIYEFALDNGLTFARAARAIMAEPKLISRLGRQIAGEMHQIQKILDSHQSAFVELVDAIDSQGLLDALRALAENLIEDDDIRADVLDWLNCIVAETGSTDHIKLLRSLSTALEDQEQELDPEKINIMTMHKAKGLTARAVIIIAAEDEYVPGRQVGDKEGDERRLLYVSLSRARHYLVVTYCEHRTGEQKYTGRTSGQSRRTLTRFLRDVPVVPAAGSNYRFS